MMMAWVLKLMVVMAIVYEWLTMKRITTVRERLVALRVDLCKIGLSRQFDLKICTIVKKIVSRYTIRIYWNWVTRLIMIGEEYSPDILDSTRFSKMHTKGRFSNLEYSIRPFNCDKFGLYYTNIVYVAISYQSWVLYLLDYYLFRDVFNLIQG